MLMVNKCYLSILWNELGFGTHCEKNTQHSADTSWLYISFPMLKDLINIGILKVIWTAVARNNIEKN